MDILDQSNNLIKNHIKLLENQVKDIKKETVFSIRKNKIRDFKSEIESIRNQLDIFDIDLCSATDKQRNIYFPLKEDYTSQVNDLESQVRQVEAADAGKPTGGLIDDQTRQRNQVQSFDQMERQELIDHVNKNKDQALDDLDDIITDLMKGKNIMQEINEEVKRQQEKLSKTREDIKETYSLTKRSRKLVSYFKRQIMTDKLLCTFIVLIIIAIIVIIVLKAIGFKSDKFNGDILPNASIDMTNSTKTS